MSTPPLIYVRLYKGALFDHVFYLDLIVSMYGISDSAHELSDSRKISITAPDLHTQIKLTDAIILFNSRQLVPRYIGNLINEYSMCCLRCHSFVADKWILVNDILTRAQITKLAKMLDKWIY